MGKRFALGITIFAASLVTRTLVAGQHSADLQHSSRVLHLTGSTSAIQEADYESRQFDGFRLGRLGPHRPSNLALASFGSTSAAIAANPLIVYFNFNGTQPPTSDTTYAQQGSIMTTVHGSAWPFGTTENAATGDTAGGAELFFLGAGSPNGGFQFSFSGVGLQDMVLSLASAGQSAATATQSLSYSVNGGAPQLLDTIPGTGNSGFKSYSFVIPADANGALSITIIDDISLDSDIASSSTLIDNVRIDVAAVPEPSTYFGAALALVAIAWMQRRRLRALIGAS